LSLFEYRQSLEIHRANVGFYALIMAAMRQADTINSARLKFVFPEVHAEMQARYDAPDGILPSDPGSPDTHQGETKHSEQPEPTG
jgi:hypothetical protein